MAITKLDNKRPIIRETNVTIDGTKLVIAVFPERVELWPKGSKDKEQRREMSVKKMYHDAYSAKGVRR